MASSNVKKRRRSTNTRKGKGGALVSHERKREVLGLILMVLSALVSLALATYSPADDAIARAFSLEAALDPGENRAVNALGLVGAALAWILVPNFLGYTVLLLAGLLFAWGYVAFRRRTPIYLPLITILTLVGAFVLACLMGWVALAFEQDLHLWSGEIGLGIAGWMQRVFGTVGSLILLLLLLAVTVLLLVDHDIQRSLDRVEEAFQALRARLQEWFAGFRERRANAKEERAAVREQHRLERAEAREERARRAETAPPPSRPAPAPRPAAQAAAPRPAADVGTRTTASPPPSPPSRRVNDLFRSADQHEGDSAPSSPAPPQPKPQPASAEHAELELKVRERIEEEKADPTERASEIHVDEQELPYDFPPIDLLDEAGEGDAGIDYEELETNKRVLLDKLDTYNIEITDINAVVGPTVTLYELSPAPGVKISRITALEDDLAMAMAARGIRMIAPIPGKSAIGVEIPNRHRELVHVRDVIATAKFRDAKMELPLPIGKTIEGEVYLQDLTKLPHLLIAGATGSGKSVGLNTIITGLLYACHPANLKFVMIDPKKIELQQYALLAEHYIAMAEDQEEPIITDFEQALGVLKSCEREMERRYDVLSRATVRSIKDYNRRLEEGHLSHADGHYHLPYIVVIVDELADLMMTAGKDIEGPIARLAQMARAVGIHLVLATQRPSVDVITGLIKANFPARIAYQVASKIDSRTILDQIGAEGLVGNGDLLYMLGSRIIRLQGPFVSVEEIDRLMEFIADQPGKGPYALPPAAVDEPVDEILGVEETDDLFEEAARIIVRSQQGSVSLLQRKLSIGYTRAARIVDQLEEAGIVGPFVGSKAREVLVQSEPQLDAMLEKSEDGEA